MKSSYFAVPMLGMALLFLSACANEPATSSERTQLSNDSMAAVNDFKAQDPSLGNLLQNSYGYAIFPSIGKGAVAVGGAYGKGEVFEQGNLVGYVEMTQGTVGLALGGQTYSELIVFQDKAALDRFRAGNFTFSANASAVALKPGLAATARFENGTSVFVNPKGGLMAEASIGGQKFNFQPL